MINVISTSASPGLSKQMGLGGQKPPPTETLRSVQQTGSGPRAMSNIVSVSGNATALERDRAVSTWERDRAAAASVIRATQLRGQASALKDEVGAWSLWQIYFLPIFALYLKRWISVVNRYRCDQLQIIIS